MDGLIPLSILQFLLDVGRQRHLAQPIQHLQENALVGKAHQPIAVRQLLRDLCCQLAIAEGDLGAGAQLLPRPHQTLPHVAAAVDEQQYLAHAAPRHAMTQQPRRQDAGIVQNQAVAGPQVLRQVKEVPVLCGTGLLIQHQQP